MAAILSVEGQADDSQHWVCFQAAGASTQKVYLTHWLPFAEKYHGSVEFRKLYFDSGHEPSIDTVTRFVKDQNGKPYEQDLAELALSVIDANTSTHLSSIFCSELVAELFIQCGYLGSDKVSNNYVPADFADEMTLIGARLGEKELIKEPTSSHESIFHRCVLL